MDEFTFCVSAWSHVAWSMPDNPWCLRLTPGSASTVWFLNYKLRGNSLSSLFSPAAGDAVSGTKYPNTWTADGELYSVAAFHFC